MFQVVVWMCLLINIKKENLFANLNNTVYKLNKNLHSSGLEETDWLFIILNIFCKFVLKKYTKS